MYSRISKVLFLLTVVFFALLYTGLAEAQHVTNGLISYWSFNEADIDGDVVADVMGKHNGAIVGDVEVVEGKIGEALMFNMNKNEAALRGDHVDVGVDINSEMSKGFTVEGWFKFMDRIVHVLMCARQGAWAASQGISFLYSNGYQAEGFTMYFRLHHAGGPCNLAYKPFEPEVGEWYHYTAAFDGSDVKFFVNGDNVASLPCAEGVDETAETLKIAHSKMFGNKWDFPGAIDEVRIYNRSLDEAEIKKNFASTGVAVEPSMEALPLTWGRIKAH